MSKIGKSYKRTLNLPEAKEGNISCDTLAIITDPADSQDYYLNRADFRNLFVLADNVITITTPAHLVGSHRIVLADDDLSGGSPITITIPASINRNGSLVYVKKIGSTSDVIIIPQTGTVDGAVSKTITIQNNAVTLVSDGSNWKLISENSLNVNEINLEDVIYIKGDEVTNDSLKLTPGTVDPANVRFLARIDDVWNNTGIEVSGATIYLGRDLQMEAAGDWVKTNEVNQAQEALLPHIEFSDEEGTVDYAKIPILSALFADSIIQPDFSEGIVTSNYEFITINPANLLVKVINYKTGSVAATEVVTVSFERPAGTIFWTRDYAPAEFSANSDVKIELAGLLDGVQGEEITTNISSAADFSLLGDSLGEAYATADFYLLTEEQVMTSTTGMDRILTDCSTCAAIIDTNGNLILSGVAP